MLAVPQTRCFFQAERSLMSPLARAKDTYFRLAIIIHCKINYSLLHKKTAYK